MGAAFALPIGPVAKQQRGVATGFDFAFLVGVEAGAIAIVVRAVRINAAGEYQFFAIGGNQDAAGFRGDAGDLLGRSAVGFHGPDLRGAAAIGDESDRLRIGEPARAFVLRTLIGDLARRSAFDGDHPDLLRFGVLIEVDGLDGERDQASVGRDLRLADTGNAKHSLDVERLLLCGE